MFYFFTQNKLTQTKYIFYKEVIMVYNFCAGPAMLPEAVLKEVQSELTNYSQCGASIMELSHRSEIFDKVCREAKINLKKLMKLDDSYDVLFLQGGASLQFSAVAMNLGLDDLPAGYINTGIWSKKALKEAKRFTDVVEIGSTEASGYKNVPKQNELNLSEPLSYVHYAPNETIGGLEFDYIPEVDCPLIADMSSTILSQDIDFSKFDMIYAGAQKNIGPAGLTIVVIKDTLLARSKLALNKEHQTMPMLMNYSVQSEHDSMYNTPPTFGIYLAGKVFEWLLDLGGISAIELVNQEKAKRLYSYLDESQLYSNPIAHANRSIMNIPFVLQCKSDTEQTAELNSRFLKAAEEHNLLNLKGHRSLGGMRASIYNAMPLSGVDALINFLKAFEQSTI